MIIIDRAIGVAVEQAARALAPRFTPLQNIVGAHLTHVRGRIILILRGPVGDSAGLLAEGLVIEGARLQVTLHLCLPGMDSKDTQFWLDPGPGKRSTPQWRTAGMMDATPRGEAQSEDVLPAVSRVMSSPNTGGGGGKYRRGGRLLKEEATNRRWRAHNCRVVKRRSVPSWRI